MEPMLEKRLKELDEVRQKVLMGGGEKRIAKQHAMGKLSARERLDILLDENSFLEMNMLAGHAKDIPGDGLVCGSGTIDGRQVYVYSQDPTVKGGSVGLEHGNKMYRTVERALECKVPFIGLHDSPGARLPTSEDLEVFSLGKRSLFSNISEKHGGSIFFPNTLASGMIPQISAILGTSSGLSVYSPALTDFIYMIDKQSHMFITGPQVVKMISGEDITKDELGGAAVHSRISGCCDFIYSGEEECLLNIRRLLSFLPLNCEEAPPAYQSNDDPKRTCEELNNIIPCSPNKPFDMHQVINAIVDNSDFYEVKKDFAPEIIVGFARLDGKTIGIVANQPMVKAGALTSDSSDKQARFIRFCDCFNIPLILLVDTPAYMPGADQEHAGIIRRGAKVLYALCEATVPRISLVLRKAYGGGNLGMGVLPGLGNDMVLYWPIVETGILGAEQSIMLLYGRTSGVTKEFIDQKLKEYRETYANPIYDISSNLNIQDVITPAETRGYLIRALKIMPDKRRNRYGKRHGNMPL
ncbi:MAG: acyl-CoA carboxylase subunit beta [Desulfosalsimonadaceae bacterium]